MNQVKFISVLIIFFMLAAAVKAELLLDGGFESSPAGFKLDGFTQNGNWLAEASVVSSFSGANGRASYLKQTMVSGEVEAQISFAKQGGNAGLIFNVSNEGGSFESFSGYEVSFNSDFSSVTLVEYGDKPRTIISMPINSQGGQWRRVHVMFSQAGLRVYLDKDEVLVLPDIKPVKAGRSGFVSRGADARFRDLRFPVNGQGRAVLLFGRETPSISASWSVLPTSRNAQFYHDDERGHHGKSSQEITAKEGVAGIMNAGVEGKGFAIKADEVMGGSIAVKAKNMNGKLFLRLVSPDGAAVYDQVEVSEITTAWRNEVFELRPKKDAADACFAVVLEGSGTVSLDSASLER